MVREEVVSTVLGYSSIASWLCAQFPQIVVNWRRKSVDGLALPFLINWFFGDATNLIGCILTHQLPFQTYVAIYFVSVDICLITQYFHYDASKDVKALSAFRSRPTSFIPPTSLSYSHTYTLPHTSISRSRSRSYSMDPHLRAAVANASLASAELDARHPDPRASDVDIQHSHARWRSAGTRHTGSLEDLPENVPADPHDQEPPPPRGRRVSDAEDTLDLESESAPSFLIESFYSEGGGGRKREKRVSWDPSPGGSNRQRSNEPHQRESSSTSPSAARGRPLTRPVSSDSQATGEETPVPRRRPASSTSLVSAARRRSASIVFLGVFALFGLGTYGMRRDVSVQGGVLTAPQELISFDSPSSADLSEPAPVLVDFLSVPSPHITSDGQTEALIGRISAWTCTTLYLTSRLPQIWKNFARKSVEGLSMYLFTFAFLGNFFYVLSILTSPKMDLPAPQARQFLRASIPYLLGSGGTLIFDVTIVLQGFVYGNRPPRHTIQRRKSLVGTASEEERGALLAADAEN